MVTATMKGVKVVMKLNEGSQTIADCSKEATDEQLHALAVAVSKLEKGTVDTITKVVETSLVSE